MMSNSHHCIGVLQAFNADYGYGFISYHPGQKPILVRTSGFSVNSAALALEDLHCGQRSQTIVSFNIQPGPCGPEAVEVERLGGETANSSAINLDDNTRPSSSKKHRRSFAPEISLVTGMVKTYSTADRRGSLLLDDSTLLKFIMRHPNFLQTMKSLGVDCMSISPGQRITLKVESVDSSGYNNIVGWKLPASVDLNYSTTVQRNIIGRLTRLEIQQTGSKSGLLLPVNGSAAIPFVLPRYFWGTFAGQGFSSSNVNRIVILDLCYALADELGSAVVVGFRELTDQLNVDESILLSKISSEGDTYEGNLAFSSNRLRVGVLERTSSLGRHAFCFTFSSSVKIANVPIGSKISVRLVPLNSSATATLPTASYIQEKVRGRVKQIDSFGQGGSFERSNGSKIDFEMDQHRELNVIKIGEECEALVTWSYVGPTGFPLLEIVKDTNHSDMPFASCCPKMEPVELIVPSCCNVIPRVSPIERPSAPEPPEDFELMRPLDSRTGTATEFIGRGFTVGVVRSFDPNVGTGILCADCSNIEQKFSISFSMLRALRRRRIVVAPGQRLAVYMTMIPTSETGCRAVLDAREAPGINI